MIFANNKIRLQKYEGERTMLTIWGMCDFCLALNLVRELSFESCLNSKEKRQNNWEDWKNNNKKEKKRSELLNMVKPEKEIICVIIE